MAALKKKILNKNGVDYKNNFMYIPARGRVRGILDTNYILIFIYNFKNLFYKNIL